MSPSRWQQDPLCDICGKEYPGWRIEDKFWKRLPQALQSQFLCKDCYWKEIYE